jgi:hypothetical protein
MKIALKFLLTLLEYFVLFRMIYRKEYRQIKWSKIIEVIVILVIVIALFYDPYYSSISATLVALIFMRLIFDMERRETIVSLIYSVLIVSLLENTVIFGVDYIIGATFINNDLITLCVIIIAEMLLGLFGVRIPQDFHEMPTKVLVLTTIVSVGLIVAYSYYTFLLSDLLNHEDFIRGFVVTTAAGVTIMMCLAILLATFREIESEKFKNSLLDTYNHQQKDYFDQLLLKEQDTRQFRHDLISELLVMKNYLNNHEYDQLRVFIDQMTSEINAISTRNYDVGNDIVNTILNYYFLPLTDNHQIKIKGFLSDDLSIEELDLTVLVSNMIKNAAESLKKQEHGYVEVNFIEENLFIYIVMKNSCVEDDSHMTTSKNKRHHGFGLKNIKKIVKKYDGVYSFDVKEGEFITDVRLRNRSSIK